MAACEVTQIPPSGTTGSRFALATSPGGWATNPGDNVVLCLNSLSEKAIREATDHRPTATVALKRVVRAQDGTHRLEDRGSVQGEINVEPSRPSRFSAPKLSAGALIDQFFLGPGHEAWDKANDQAIWNALRDLAEQLDASPAVARKLSDETARLICLRAGIRLGGFDVLPN